jgi:phosphonate transport system ATP-binding protein
MLELIGLSKRYRTGDLALDSVSLTVPKGQVMALIGPSGAGKSTLIRCVNRLVEPTAGQVLLGREELTRLSKGALRRARRRMGMIFQEYALVERLTVMENILSGRLGYVGFWSSWFRRFPPGDIAEAFRLLDRVGLTAMRDKRADALSGGQRQRVGIVRALMQDPDLLLVDEPTASLDPKTSRQIMRLIVELCAERGLAAIINIHDVALAQMFAARVVGLRAGRIVYDGPPEGLTPAVLTEIYGEEDWHATISGGALLYLVLAVGTLEVNWARAADGLDRGARFIGGFFPPDFVTKREEIADGLLESLAMTVVSTVLGILLSIPFALGASHNLAPLPVYLFCRGVIAISRTFQEIIIAILFVAMFGFGPLAGTLTLAFSTIGFLGKLLAEDIEDIQLAQAEAVRATGAGWWQVLDFAIAPQVMPRFIGLSVYRLDINFREAAVLGLVGAGGIGDTLNNSFERYEFDTAAAILIIIIAIVMACEYSSSWIRRKVQ